MKDKQLEQAKELKNKIGGVEWELDIIENKQQTLQWREEDGKTYDKCKLAFGLGGKDISVPHYLAEQFLDALKDHYIEKQVNLERQFDEL